MRIHAESFVRWRGRLVGRPLLDLAYRVAVGVVGAAVLIVGIVTIPYPGPGWLIVFAGLGILASEFAWAKRLLQYARGKYDAFMAWFLQQGQVVQGAGLVFTCAVVLGTLWVLGGVGMAAGWFGLEQDWLAGPFG
ncbi:TIGR02611 family protein [Tomitella biformata]|uniref:TIGR02611 family protein n=1 Tax=Tomitella biformata TaxID=630403 RepID=UPI0004634CFE|nr:TIGR02611 family protein [Tomitella biformata]